jgi:two-component system sensor kinase FixL
MPFLERLLSYRVRSRAAKYGLAPLGIGAATLLSVGLYGGEIRGSPFVPIIMLIAWYGGLGPGLFAVFLAALALSLLGYEPRFTPRMMTPRETWYLTTFSLSTTFIAWLTSRFRRSQHALAQQARLLDLAHDAVFVRDRADVIRYWNLGAEERYGWTRDEALGKQSHVLLETAFPTTLTVIEETLSRTGRWEGQLTHTRRDGAKVIVASRWSRQRDETGAVTGVLETNNDITEQVRAADAWRQTQAELAHVARVTMLGEITASMAHEINQPLAAVIMNANAGRRWLEATPPNVAEALQSTRRIAADGERASQVITRVRSLVRKQAPEPAALNINEVIEDTLGFTGAELEQRRVTIRASLAPNLPNAQCDRVQLQQVLVNLILNSIDAMSAVEPASRLLLIESVLSDRNQVAVSVSDCGRGISPEHATRIFEAFFSTKANGLGMGLSVSRSIIEQHGGKIWAEPNSASGATFRFTLPAGAA